MILVSGLSLAVGGLANIDRQLALIAHNVSNAGTPGYVQEIATQTAMTVDGTGIGVRSGLAIRDIDVALRAELWTQDSMGANVETRQTALSTIDAVHGTPGAGGDIASLLGAVRDNFSSLANDPANQAGQRAVVDSASALTTAINTLANTYNNRRQVAQNALVDDIATLNQNLHDIGVLSDSIIRLKSIGQSTADLESQRDTVIGLVAQSTNVKALTQANGDVLLVAANGLMLPTRADSGPFKMGGVNIGAQAWYPGGGVPGVMMGGVDVTAQFTTGRIGANLSLRDTILPSYQAALDELAQTLATRFDAQGVRLFADPNGVVPAGGGIPVQAGYVGFSQSVQVNPALLADASLVRDGTQAVAGSATGASAFTPNPLGGPAGFSTIIQRVIDFALGREAQTGVPQPLANISGLGASGTLSAPFAAARNVADIAENLIADQAADSANAALQRDRQKALSLALQARYDDRTAVNIDAEMAQMVQLQNAYGANARVISASQTMWDQLLGAVQ